MSRRKRKAHKKGRTPKQNNLVRDPGCEEDDVNQGFIDGLDHAAFHIAEQMREKTHVWKETGYAPIDFQMLPALARPLVRQSEDWKRLAEYILKWMRWYLTRDSLLLYGGAVAELHPDPETRLSYLIIGYETQSEASRN